MAMIECPECEGTGYGILPFIPCEECDGEGEVDSRDYEDPDDWWLF